MNKKASLQLSIQAIIIIVIAFVVLGLGLGFVKNTFKDISGTTKEVQSKIKEQVLEDLRTSGKKLSVSSQVQLDRGSEIVDNVGIVNTGLSTEYFGVSFEFIKKQNQDGSPGQEGTANDPKEIVFFYSSLIDKQLAPTQGDVIPVTISAKSSAAGNYLYKVDVWQCPFAEGPQAKPGANCKIYDTRSFFVRVS